VPLEETSSNNGAIHCPRNLRKSDVRFEPKERSKTNKGIELPRGCPPHAPA